MLGILFFTIALPILGILVCIGIIRMVIDAIFGGKWLFIVIIALLLISIILMLKGFGFIPIRFAQ